MTSEDKYMKMMKNAVSTIDFNDSIDKLKNTQEWSQSFSSENERKLAVDKFQQLKTIITELHSCSQFAVASNEILKDIDMKIQ